MINNPKYENFAEEEKNEECVCICNINFLCYGVCLNDGTKYQVGLLPRRGLVLRRVVPYNIIYGVNGLLIIYICHHGKKD